MQEQNLRVDQEALLQRTQSPPEYLTQGLCNQLVHFDKPNPAFKNKYTGFVDNVWIEMIGESDGKLVGGIREFKDNGQLWVAHVYYDENQKCWRLNHDKTSSGAFQLISREV